MLTPIRKLFATRAARRRQARRKDDLPRTARPQLEALEERQVPTVVYNGGAVLQNVEAQALYIGDQWTADPNLSSQVGFLEGYLGTIVNSSFMDMLSNAGYGVGRGSASPGQFLPVSLDSTNFLQDSTIRGWIQDNINSGVLQQPDANTLYVCFVEPNVAVQTGFGDTINSILGYHGAFAGTDSAGQAADIRYAVVTYGGGSTVGGSPNASVPYVAGPIQQDTLVASHEIAEAATDPDINYKTFGWYDPANGEVGDIAVGQTMYVNGYAMQRISDQNDQPMTPAQATSDRPVNFVLQSNGDLYEIVNGSPVYLASGIASVSPQGIDNMGHAQVDVVTAGGDAYEYHDEVGWTYLTSGVASAVAGQGVSYVLYTNGVVQEYNGNTGAWTTVANGASQIDAGTDKLGVNCVDFVTAGGDAYEYSDDSGFHYIASGVQSISAGRQGFTDYVTAGGVAYFHQEGAGADVYLASNVLQVAAGTDANGNAMIDMLTADGTVSELRYGGSWTALASGVTSLNKGSLDAVDMMFSWGDAWQYSGAGWGYLGGSAAAAA
jgi:hypothetical protein